jgi:hypothetical protein
MIEIRQVTSIEASKACQQLVKHVSSGKDRDKTGGLNGKKSDKTGGLN